MRWAQRRDTTKEEDQAYCLLGVFGIYLPLIYGEGKKHALKRLREEIKKQEEVKECSHPKAIEFLQTLRTSDYEQFKDRNPDRLEGTCNWFLRHDHFITWQQASSALLWVSADPGCGKSVLAKSLANQELRSIESRTCCFFFFKDDSYRQKDINYALSALLHQLFSQKRSLLHHALQDYEEEGAWLVQSFHKLWKIFLKVTSDPSAGEIVCILDAIDECEEFGRHQIISALNALYKQMTLSRQGVSGPSVSQLKFIVTSRPYHDIERRFTALTHQFPTIRLRGEQESEAISREISVVIKWRVSELGSELGLDALEQATLQDELLRIKHRTYLWLRLILDVIRDEIVLTKRRLKQIIHTLPTTVDQTYEAILSKIRERDCQGAQKVLSIVVAAARPLTLREMNIALALSTNENSRSYEDLDLEEEERFKTTIRHLCGLFVNVVDRKVYLIHQTAKGFLVEKAKEPAGQWKISINIVESELMMAKICITYLNFTVFGLSSNKNNLDGFLLYAACFWTNHYRQAQRRVTMELLQGVLNICEPESPRYQNWACVYWQMMENQQLPSFPGILMVGSFFGHVSVVRQLLDKRDVDFNAKDAKNGMTALTRAAERGHEAVVKALLERDDVNVNAKDNFGMTALMRADENGHEAVVRQLLERDDVDVATANVHGVSALMQAAGHGHEAVVELLLGRDNVDVNAKDTFGMTALMQAAANGHEAVFKQLLAERDIVDVNAFSLSRQTALMQAAMYGHDAVVKLLVERDDVDVNAKGQEFSITHGEGSILMMNDRNGHLSVKRLSASWTALMLAADHGHDTVVKLLLERHDVDVNTKEEENGYTALMLAADRGHDTVVKLLLKRHDVDVNTKAEGSGYTALMLAANRGHEAVVGLLAASLHHTALL
jgi:ankyrin repeat protein